MDYGTLAARVGGAPSSTLSHFSRKIIDASLVDHAGGSVPSLSMYESSGVDRLHVCMS